MKERRTNRRETLRYLGAAGVTALVGCGENNSVGPDSNASAGGNPGSGGNTGTGSGGMLGSSGGSTASGSGGTGTGSAGAAGSSGGSMEVSCIVRPQQTEGPYFIDERLLRSDIRSDPTNGTVKEGVPLRLVVLVGRTDGTACTPLQGAMVDVWQCDALGVYAGVVDFNGQFDTQGQKFLRGHQLTDASGRVEFLTIYPGWYTGRTVHIHFKVRTAPDEPTGFEFTSQLYFDEAINDAVMNQAPYNSKGPRSTTNQQDGIFQSGGQSLLLDLRADNEGYTGTISLGLQMA